MGEIPKTGTRVDITRVHKYNTVSITKRINHVTTFKNALFLMGPTEKLKLHRGSDYHTRIEPKKDTIILVPMANYIHCETIGRNWGGNVGKTAIVADITIN